MKNCQRSRRGHRGFVKTQIMKTKIGILGGGQLARMMLPSMSRFALEVKILDSMGAVCQEFCQGFVVGSFKDADTVEQAFKDCDVVTMDLEAVSTEGLKRLEAKGVTVAPSSCVIELIQNKIEQKKFFLENAFPTSKFKVLEKVTTHTEPGFLKLPTGGYDGKGVTSFNGDLDALAPAFQTNVLWEEKVSIEKELSVIVARNRFKEMACYQTTEMVFDHDLNLIKYTLFPAPIDTVLEHKAQVLACEIAEKLDLHGVLAVEMFLTSSGELLVNELAPRPHNSGHHTIESCMTSQYENHIRGCLGSPLGSTAVRDLSLTFNLIGEGEGDSVVEGHEELMAEEGCFIHLYGKKDCRDGRKMGHVTLVASSYAKLEEKYQRLHKKIKVKGVSK